MKKVLISFGFILLFQFTANSQETDPELQIPGSPGMDIIGVQNVEISKPGNYTGVYSSLISPIIANNGTIPTNLALEFSPYYLESRDLTYKELNKTNLFRDFKISIASNSVTDSDSNHFSRLGMGFRTNLISGKINNPVKKKMTLSVPAEIRTTINKINSGIFGNIDTADVSKFIDHITDKELRQRVADIITGNKDNKDKLLNMLTELNDEIDKLVEIDGSRWDYSLRTGHFVEIAFALALDFPKNTIEYSDINRWGIWLNYTFRPESKNQAIDFSALVRISDYSFDPSVTFNNGALFADLGVSVNWKIPKSKFVVSGELVSKVGFTDIEANKGENEYTFKSVTESKWNGSVGYQITPNTLWSVSFSDINGNSSYLKNNSMQILMGLSAALAPIRK
ncbi:MAG: hypothetical protein ACOYMF_05855 [Bacteroidales bacterium]